MKMKRFLTMLLAVTLLFMGLPNMGALTTVEGADGGQVTGNDEILVGKQIDTIYGSAVKGSDGAVYKEYSFTAVNYSDGSYTTKKTNTFDCKELIGVDNAKNQSWLYCVEYNTGFSRNGYSGTNVGNSNYLRYGGTLATGLNKLAKDKGINGLNGNMSVQYILTATIYGWQPDAAMPTELKNQGLNDWDWYYGTQVVIWEFQQGIRQSPTQRNGNGFNTGDTLFKWVDGRPAEYAYNYVIKMMAQHNTIPSFAKDRESTAPAYTLKWSNTNKRYELTLPDTAGYAFDLKFADSDIKCTKSGSNFTIYTSKTITSPALQKIQKQMNIASNQELLVWGKSGKQTMVSGMQDPVAFYLKIQTELPTIIVKKTGESSDDIANKLFYVYKDGSSTACLKLTTDANGNASGSLPGEGSYKVVEQNTSKYNVTYTINGTSTQTFTYPGSRDANNNVTINVKNETKKGVVHLKKESDDKVVQGFRFQLKNKATGETVEGTTNANGYLVVNGSTDIKLKPGTYTVTELNQQPRYETLEPFDVYVETGKTITVTANNKLKWTKLTIQKASEDDLIAGLEFRITGTSLSGNAVDKTVFTGADGTVTVDLEQGSYTVSEVNVPGKYYIPNSQRITLNYTSQTINFVNELKPAQLQILKTSEDGIVDGMKFRVTGNGVNITGFTNTDGYVVFGKKAYLVEGQALQSTLKRFAVVSKDATAAEVLSDLGLDSATYAVVYNNTIAIPNDAVVATYNATTNASVTGSGWMAIRNTTGSTYYAQIIFKGSAEKGSAAGGVYGVTANDLTGAKSVLGKAMNGTYSNDVYIAAYDLDRDGTVTQADINVMQEAHDNKTDLVGSAILDVEAGDYRIQEIEVPDRYTAGFDQTVHVEGTQAVTVVKVKNYLETSGAKIVKKSEDGKVANVKFRIAGIGNTVNMEVVTDETGIIAQKLPRGMYRITELEVDDIYVTPASKVVNLTTNAYTTVTFENKLKDGTIQIIKKSPDDGIVANVKFRIASVGYTDKGTVVNEEVITGTNGVINQNLPGGTYVITELDVDGWYVDVPSQTIKVTPGQTATVTFVNSFVTNPLKLIKKSPDGNVANIEFTVEGTTRSGKAYSQTFKTDETGVIAENIPQGDYTVTEKELPGYEEQEPQTVSLRNGELKTLTFNNVPVKGTLEIIKVSENGNVADIAFHVSGFGSDGVYVDAKYKTNEKGVITTDLYPGEYTVTELLDDTSYIIPEAQIVNVTYSQAASVTFENKLKKFKLSLTKTDGSTEISIPQQEGAMEGAVYGLYKKDGTLMAEYTTGKDGKFTTEAIPCEAAYVQEITAPKGYTLDESQYWLASSADECYLDVTNLSLNVVDYPIMGSINILKKMGLSDKWEYEAGAVFQIYPKSAGSYDAANEWERDEIITDAAYSGEDSNTGEAHTGGTAGTKDLPLGTYIVHQVSGAEGCLLADDIEVQITEEETVISLDILNLRIVQDEFPFTGGSGIAPYVVGSIIIMLMAVVVAVSTREKETV